MLFDLAARRFYIFGMVLHPQDVIYLAGLLIFSALGLFLFTAVAGRLWCGYACPQTVYTEIFMWVEHRFEGDRQARIKLDAAPWTATKLLRTRRQAARLAGDRPVDRLHLRRLLHPGEGARRRACTLRLRAVGVFWILFYGLATYGNAGYMREQVCKYMCPYARFQSAMFDRDTLIISYDARPRRAARLALARRRPASVGKGDCIDCTLCVQVCPTGIDIRKGLQYECIGCAACIDACDDVMDKMGSPRGLIRYATQNGMEKRWTRREMWHRVLRPRVLVYGAILLAVAAAFVASLALRAPFKADIVRDRGALARLVDDGRIENVYRVQLMNGTEQPQRFRIAVEGLEGATLADGREVELEPTEARWVPLAVQVPPHAARKLGPGAHPMRFRIACVGTAAPERPRGVRPGLAERREKSTFVIPR